jgi:hypothetical protein
MDRTGKPDGAGSRMNSQHGATLSLSLVCRYGGDESSVRGLMRSISVSCT